MKKEQEIKKYFKLTKFFSTKNFKVKYKNRYLKKSRDLIVVEKYPLQTEKLLCSKYNDISLNTPVPNMKKKKRL